MRHDCYESGNETMNAFLGYHPIINFLYFSYVILFSMFFMHPAALCIALVCAFAYSVKLGGRESLKFNVLYMLPLLLISALVNPAFNHEGVTILTYLSSGNPLTLESITYGIAAACMIVTVIMWFSCYNRIMTSDKFIYLFGRVIPALSLILSMALRFVPKFKAQIKVISNAQKCIGRDVSNGNLLQRAKHGIKIVSIMITWSLENAIETADSMRGRGYGLKGRTAFSIFRFDSRDKKALAVIGGLGTYVIIGSWFGGMYWRYFPSMKGGGIGIYSVSVFAAYFALCITPFIIEVWEDRMWRRLRSSI